jgi:NADPH:quinone reductase-like Zn-dependent oxidoreductase
MTGLPYLIRVVVPTLGLRKPKVPVQGMDLAGTVAAVGQEGDPVPAGEAVVGWTDGSFAQDPVAPEDNLARSRPPQLRAGRGRAHLRVRRPPGLRDQGAVQPAQRVLVIGAAGGSGRSPCSWHGVRAQVTGVASTTQVELVGSLGRPGDRRHPPGRG